MLRMKLIYFFFFFFSSLSLDIFPIRESTLLMRSLKGKRTFQKKFCSFEHFFFLLFFIFYFCLIFFLWRSKPLTYASRLLFVKDVPLRLSSCPAPPFLCYDLFLFCLIINNYTSFFLFFSLEAREMGFFKIFTSPHEVRSSFKTVSF